MAASIYAGLCKIAPTPHPIDLIRRESKTQINRHIGGADQPPIVGDGKGRPIHPFAIRPIASARKSSRFLGICAFGRFVNLRAAIFSKIDLSPDLARDVRARVAVSNILFRHHRPI